MQWKSSEILTKTLHKVQKFRFILKRFTINSKVQPNMNSYQSLENGERKIQFGHKGISDFFSKKEPGKTKLCSAPAPARWTSEHNAKLKKWQDNPFLERSCLTTLGSATIFRHQQTQRQQKNPLHSYVTDTNLVHVRATKKPLLGQPWVKQRNSALCSWPMSYWRLKTMAIT